jgi:hypothetical protein
VVRSVGGGIYKLSPLGLLGFDLAGGRGQGWVWNMEDATGKDHPPSPPQKLSFVLEMQRRPDISPME